MRAYGLTDSEGRTRRNRSQTLEKGSVIALPLEENGPSVIHAYNHPLTAVFMDPRFERYGKTARLFEIESDAPWNTDGCARWISGDCLVIQELVLPRVSVKERVAAAILLNSHQITKDWGVKWLAGEYRTQKSLRTVKTAVESGDATWWAAWWAARQGPEWVRRESATYAALAAEGTAMRVDDPKDFESRIPLAIERARKILAKEIPVDQAWL